VVAALLDPLCELLDARPLRVKLDRRRLRDGVRIDVDDSGPAAEHSFDDGLLARVLEAADVQDGRD